MTEPNNIKDDWIINFIYFSYARTLDLKKKKKILIY